MESTTSKGNKPRLNVWSWETLFSDSEEDSINKSKSTREIEAFKKENDAHDELLNLSYKEFERMQQSTHEMELCDGFDSALNESYNKVKEQCEPCTSVTFPQLSRKEIRKNHLLAQFRLIENKRRWNLREEMSDYFFSLVNWPLYALELLNSMNFGYTERISLATFLHGNGLYDEVKALRIF